MIKSRGPKWYSIFMYDSLKDNSAFKQRFAEFLGDKEFVRKLSVLSVDNDSGQVYMFDETLGHEERVELIASSGAIGGLIEPGRVVVNGKNVELVDGSYYSTVSIADSI